MALEDEHSKLTPTSERGAAARNLKNNKVSPTENDQICQYELQTMSGNGGISKISSKSRKERRRNRALIWILVALLVTVATGISMAVFYVTKTSKQGSTSSHCTVCASLRVLSSMETPHVPTTLRPELLSGWQSMPSASAEDVGLVTARSSASSLDVRRVTTRPSMHSTSTAEVGWRSNSIEKAYSITPFLTDEIEFTMVSLQYYMSSELVLASPISTPREVSCSGASLLPFDRGVWECNYAEGVCSWLCQDGYEAIVLGVAYCAGRTWIYPQTPQCELVKCGSPPIPRSMVAGLHAAWTCPGEIRYNDTCYLSCGAVGYLSSNPMIRCNSSGLYDGEYTDCMLTNPCVNSALCADRHSRCVNDELGAYKCVCADNFAGNGSVCGHDSDRDGYPDEQLLCTHRFCRKDNCKDVPNSGQEDADNDGVGDTCDSDIDNDGIPNISDTCPLVATKNQVDSDRDTVGDDCDNCREVPNKDQADLDVDGFGDMCDADVDGDGISNANDNCWKTVNPDQIDYDGDMIGDACDNCKFTKNADQSDIDGNQVGDACETSADSDRDGIADAHDNCQKRPNANQIDTDKDGVGDACDTDIDGDGISNTHDNCMWLANSDQMDADKNRIGDACQTDEDGDGVPNDEDDFPVDKWRQSSGFSNATSVVFGERESGQASPEWHIFDQGREILQVKNGNPGALLTKDAFDNLMFSGTLVIKSPIGGADDDYVGIVFGYQSNRNFYLASWKAASQHYNILPDQPYPRAVARAGISLKRITSLTGPGIDLRNALWETLSTVNQSRLLWFSPNIAWRFDRSYRWRIEHNPDSGRIRVRFYEGNRTIADSKDVYDHTFAGGRAGVYVFSQEQVLFSNMRLVSPKVNSYSVCTDESSSLKFGILEKLLPSNGSFALSMWIKFDGPTSQIECSLQPQVTFGQALLSFGMPKDFDASDPFKPFLQDTDDEDDWLLSGSATSTPGTGPQFDHTTKNGSGNYAYIEGSGKPIGTRSTLTSPWFRMSFDCSFSFWYHMYAEVKSEMGSLLLEIQGAGDSWDLIWTREGSQGDTWYRATPDVTNFHGRQVRMRFTAVRGFGKESDIAIDDVSFGDCVDSNACTDDRDKQYIFGTASGQGLFLYVSQGRLHGGVDSSVESSLTNPFPYNDWTYVSIGYDRNRREQYIRCNNDSIRDYVKEQVRYDEELVVGGTGARRTRGTFDEFRIWSVVEEEVKWKDQFVDGSVPGLHALFSFEEGQEGLLREEIRGTFLGQAHNVSRVSSSLRLLPTT